MASKKNNALNLSMGVDVDGFKKDFEEAVRVTKGATSNIEKDAAKMALEVSSKLEKMTPTRQMRQLENLAVKMTEMGMAGTQAFTMVVQSAAELKSTISDTGAIIDAMQPDAPFRSLSNLVQGSAQAFAGMQGAMALLGVEGEETQETLLKVQAAMAFADGLESIGMLEDAFEQVGIMVKANVIPSLFTLKGALIATGIGAAVVAVGMLISHFKELSDAADDAAESADAALNFADKVRKRDKISEEIALNNAKARGASDKELYEIKWKYAKIYYDHLIEEQKKAGDAAWKFDEAIESQLQNIKLLNSQFLADQASKKKQTTTSGTRTPQKKDEFDQWKKIDDVRKSVKGAGVGIFDPIEVSARGAVQAIEAVPHALNFTAEKLQELRDEIAVISVDIGQLLSDSIGKGIEDMAMALGTALEQGTDVGRAIGQTFLMAVADFGKQLGSLIIAAGVAKLNLDTALAIPGGAPAAIAAGAALIVASAALSSHLNKGVQAKGFASGGLIGGNSFSGDRLLAPVNSGEVILNTGQQNELLRIANGSAGGGTLMHRIEGRDLLIWLNRAQKDYSRG